MSRTLVKVSVREDVVRVRIYSKEVEGVRTFSFFMENFEFEDFYTPHLYADLENYVRLMKVDGSSGNELIFEFMWLHKLGRSEYKGRSEVVRVNLLEFMNAIGESRKLDGGEKTLLNIEIKMPTVEVRSAKNIKRVAQNKQIRKKFSSFLGKNFQWQNTKKITLFDDFDPYSFYFEEQLYTDSDGLCGGIIYHGDCQSGRYEIHT